MWKVNLPRQHFRLLLALSAFFIAGDLRAFVGFSQDRASQPPKVALDMVRDDSMKPNEPYRVGQRIRVKVTVKNESADQITVALINVYFQNRLELFRNGKLVSYRSEIAKALRTGEAEGDMIGLGKRDFIRLQPYSSATVKIINLSDWYDSLERGSYRLTNRFRPRIGGPWSEDSEAVVFEVAPPQK